MKLVIFAGHHKVGSTSLQDYLARNSLALARAGILYPAVDFEGMALMLGGALGRGVPENLPINAREPHNALAFRMLAERKSGRVPHYHEALPARGQMVRALRKQVEFLKPDAVVMAAEVFANFAATDPQLIADLAAILPTADITVIFTLRRIDEYLASWHGQRLKFGHKLAPLREDGLDGYFGNIHFDYRLMLEGWLQTLPDARFVIREYGQVRAAGGSVADFIAQSGLSFPDGLEEERKTNESLHRGVAEIARLGNHALPDQAAGALRKFLRKATPDLGLPGSGEVELFGAENRVRLADRFAPIADWLGTVAGQAPFFPDPDALLTCRPVPELSAHATALAALGKVRDRPENARARDFLDTLLRESAA